MGLTFGAALLIAVIAAIFRSEFEACMPWLAERLRRLALKLLSGAIRDRLDEEWAAYLQEIPGYLAKLVCAAGFVLAAGRIGAATFTRRLAYRSLGLLSKRLIALSSSMSRVSLLSRNRQLGALVVWLLCRGLVLNVWRLGLVPNLALRTRARADALDGMRQFSTMLSAAAEAVERGDDEFKASVNFPDLDGIADDPEFGTRSEIGGQ